MGDKLENRKLSIDWAGPYIFEGMINSTMAQVAKIDSYGNVLRRFQVHGSKIRLCQMPGQLEDDGRKNAIQPGVLPDFPDSEVSEPLYGSELRRDSIQQPASRPSQKQSVRRDEEYPRSEIPDEALRTEIREENNQYQPPQPDWQAVNDEIMDEISDREWRTSEWVERTIQTHDSISINEQEERMDYGEPMRNEQEERIIYDEPMRKASYGATEQEARRRVWNHAQRLADKDGRPRIPPKTLISEAPDVESQAALRRGVAAEKYRNKRDQHRYKEREKNRRILRPASRTNSAYRWKKVPYSQKTTRARPHKPQTIHLESRYDSLREYESDEFHYTPDNHTQIDGKSFHPRSSIHSGVESRRMNSGGGRVRRNRGRQDRERTSVVGRYRGPC